ncbi:hypothetical protein [Roseivirga seohaensis]|uniref:hypothetical protein n=1 Tax=Roseivirga seohaensis TaxID=1914963 RepID=UPI003BAA8F9F
MNDSAIPNVSPQKYLKEIKEVDLTGCVSGDELLEAYRIKTRETLTKKLKAAYSTGKLSFDPHRIVYFDPWQVEEIFSALGHPYGRKE